MTDYSQHGEQATILSYFGGTRYGTFLDIGANDGVRYSNTKALSDLGWFGTYVEPSPAAFAALRQNLPKSKAFPVAITEADGAVELFESDEASHHLISTTIASERERWGVCRFRGVMVSGWSFAKLLAESCDTQYDFISIDAEGADLAIFKQIDLTELGVSMVCAEHNGRGLTEFDSHARAHGFARQLVNGCNVIYSK
jgi:FkbM family methyltransferase